MIFHQDLSAGHLLHQQNLVNTNTQSSQVDSNQVEENDISDGKFAYILTFGFCMVLRFDSFTQL